MKVCINFLKIYFNSELTEIILLLTEAIIGLREVSYLVDENIGNITVYIEFLSPANISADVEVNVTVYTMNGTATGNKTLYTHEPQNLYLT